MQNSHTVFCSTTLARYVQLDHIQTVHAEHLNDLRAYSYAQQEIVSAE